MEFRRAHPADAEAIREVGIASWWAAYTPLLPAATIATVLARGWSVAAINEHMSHPLRVVLVATVDKAVVGLLFAAENERSGWPTVMIERLYVRPEWQGQQVGYGLWQAYRQSLAATVEFVELDVLVGNERALAFYQRQGFIETHRFMDTVAGLPMPLIYMRWTRPRHE